MKICVIGTGYVGLVAGSCLADMGNDVICVDKDVKKLELLNKGVSPIYEPGLEELIQLNMSEGRLKFTNDLSAAVEKSQVCFMAVGTPEDKDGKADLSALFDAAEQISYSINNYKIIVNKSTAPVGTALKLKEIISKNAVCEFDIVSNPEFLKQGAAVEDFLKPDRVVIGSDSKKATKIMQELYAPHTLNGNPVIIMDIKSAEMTKYAANCFLAMKISYINEIANICERAGADIQLVKAGMCSDKRIGQKFLFPGIGFGGSCFPKDLKALINIARDCGLEAELLKSVCQINLNQRKLFVKKILNRFDSIEDKTFALWGLSFKPKTNDMREAPSIDVIRELLKHGAKIKVFDPKAHNSAEEIFKDSIQYSDSSYSALEGVDALLLLTEWHEFRMPDFKRMSALMREKIIFDGRNLYDPLYLKELGFEYHSIGRS